MKNIIIFISSLLFVYTASAQDEQAQKYVEKEQYVKAISIYKNLLKSNVKKASEYNYYLGDIYWRKEKLDSAKYYYMEGIKADETNALNYVGIGIVSMPKNATEGQRSFEKAMLMTSEKNVRVLIAIGEYYVLEGSTTDLPKGISYLIKATQVDAKNAMAWMLLGDAYGRQAEGSKQVEAYNKAGTLFHSIPLLKMKYGKLYTSARNFDLSVKYYNEGLQSDSTYGPIYRELGDLYSRFKKYDLAITNYKSYLTYIDRNDDVEFKYAYFLLKNKDYSDVVDILTALEKRKYPSVYIYNRRAVCYYELKNYTPAQKDIETYFSKVDITKTTSVDYEYYGKILLAQGQDSVAILKLEEAVRKDNGRLDLYGTIGSYYFEKGDYAKAIEYMKMQVTSETKDAKVFYELGQAYYYNKEYASADSNFVKVIEIKPALYLGYFWRARANAAIDPETKKGLAKPYFEKAIEICAQYGTKYKDELIEANEYMGYYYTINRDKVKADIAWKNILALEPTNSKAINGLKMK